MLACDLCIVGGGAAGITLARELSGTSSRVILLESGDVDARASTRALSEGTSVGAPYRALDACRVRALGGTTHVWGGWARPLDEDDFQSRDWIPDSGWPFSFDDLNTAYARAHEICGLASNDYDVGRWRGAAMSGLCNADPALVREIIFQIAPTRFAAAHSAALRTSLNVSVLLGATALGISTSESGDALRGVGVATLANTRFDVSARFVVLAAGGLENPRLLLASAGGGSHAMGNDHDLVGRYFMDHLHVPVGTLIPDDVRTGQMFQLNRVGGFAFRAGLALALPARRDARLLGSAVTLHNEDDPHDVLSPKPSDGGYESLMVLLRALRRGRTPERALHHAARVVRDADNALILAYRKLRRPAPRRLTIGLRVEQAPNRESRVQLDATRDRFGIPRLRLDWRISDQDLESLHRTQLLLGRALKGMGVRMFPKDGDLGWAARVAPGAHHMGTTRMHRDPVRGVVDEHGRVHGTRNVYVTGSSVFPTGGWAPPTLTVVALAVRLASHFRQVLR